MFDSFRYKDFDFKSKGFFFGVVEDVMDPLTIGRVRVRCFGYHTAEKSKIPTEMLPWANVLQPGNSASMSGVGWSPNGLLPGSHVFGIFLDGRSAQYPFVLGSLAGVHRPQFPGTFGNSGAGYSGPGHPHSGGAGSGPYDTSGLPADVSYKGRTVGDMKNYLTKDHIQNWDNFLEIYTHTPSRGDNGLACKDSARSLKIHYASALLLEELTRQVNGGKAFGINSAYRSLAYNRARGIKESGRHSAGKAFDIKLSSINDLRKFVWHAIKLGFIGFGLYGSFVHIDTYRATKWGGFKSGSWDKFFRQAGWRYGMRPFQGVKSSGAATTQTPSTSTPVPQEKPTTTTGSTAGGATSTGATTTSTPVPQEKPTTSSGTTPGSNVGGGDIKYTPGSVEGQIVEYWRNKGLQDHQIAAILGSAKAESSFQPHIRGDSGNAYGLMQWNDRRSSLFRHSGTSSPNVQQQMDFMYHEFQTTEKTSWNMLRSATNVNQAMEAMHRYERFNGWNNASGAGNRQNRLNYANGFYTGKNVGSTIASGFSDPTGSMPYGGFKGKPSTHPNARGFNGMAGPDIIRSTGGGLTSVPMPGDRETFAAMPDGARPTYPHNHVYATKAGHFMEWDDTPGASRINIQHQSGSKYEITDKGSKYESVKNHEFRSVAGDSASYFSGQFIVTSGSDMKIRSTADISIHADGAYSVQSYGDRTEQVAGRYDIHAGESVQIKGGTTVVIDAKDLNIYASKSLKIQSAGEIHFKGKSIKMEGAEGVDIKSGKSLNMEAAGGDLSLKGSGTSYLDGGKVRLGEDGGSATGAEPAVNADLGDALKRRKIEKPVPKDKPVEADEAEQARETYGQMYDFSDGTSLTREQFLELTDDQYADLVAGKGLSEQSTFNTEEFIRNLQ